MFCYRIAGAHSICLQAFISGAYVNGNSSPNVCAGYKRCERINEEGGLISARSFEQFICIGTNFLSCQEENGK